MPTYDETLTITTDILKTHVELDRPIRPNDHIQNDLGLDSLGVASYLLTLYFSCAVLTDDALGLLENVEVGYYHDYEHRGVHGFLDGAGI